MAPKLILLCGPSGSGKTTIVQHLLKTYSNLSFSVSATTRSKRSNEINGKDYYFLTVEEFRKKIQADEFLEWEEVYTHGFYGTLRSEVDRIAAMGKVAIFDVDVEGGVHIKGRYGKNLLDVFVRPPSVEDLYKRLVARASETPESLEKRILKATHELTYADRFNNVIINKDMHVAFAEAENLVSAFLNDHEELPVKK
ncbi:MAG: guanylate kinase [Bacteroidetes bacterium]|nr:guanylate kinase [Bacteroidota bacterium]